MGIVGRPGYSANPGPPGTRSDEPADGGADGTTPPLGGPAQPASINPAGNQCQGREESNMEGLLSSYHEAIVANRANENVRTLGAGGGPDESGVASLIEVRKNENPVAPPLHLLLDGGRPRGRTVGAGRQ